MPKIFAKDARAYGGPGKYVQGPGEINNIYKWVSLYGDSALFIFDTFFFDRYSEFFRKNFEENQMRSYALPFDGDPCEAELEKLMTEVRKLPEKPAAVMGMGGGKACDMGKAVAAELDAVMFVIPTAVSCDAPCTTHSVFYDENHNPYSKIHRKNPEFVIVDTEITITSPVSMFQAGLGDAMATYYEGRAALATGNVNNVLGGIYKPTICGAAIIEACKKTLLEKGRAAYLAAKNHVRTQAYEDVAEANVMLSGVGFENTAVSISHGIEMALHSIKTKPIQHGTGVGYGVLIQLIVENRSEEEFKEIYEWTYDVGLPVCLEDLGVKDDIAEAARTIGQVGCTKWMVHNVPFMVTEDMVTNAVLYLEAYTKAYREGKDS